MPNMYYQRNELLGACHCGLVLKIPQDSREGLPYPYLTAYYPLYPITMLNIVTKVW